MIIINSGAYVPPELQTEFGAIPPCMLPLANRKLIEHQARALAAAFPERTILVSLPGQYAMTVHETELLERLGVSVIRTPEHFSLCAALVYILSVTESGDDGVRILRGDTLFDDFPKELDLVSVAPSPEDGYKREKERAASTGELVWTGFFSFSSAKSLIRCLALAKDSFTDAVRAYGREHPLHFAPAGQWFDLGRVNTYFRSRAALTTQRAFNTLSVKANVVTKTGTPPEKIEAEASWFRQAPARLRKYLPQLIAHGHEAGRPYYQLEYLPLSPLNELFVHGRNPASFWEYAFDLVKSFFVDAGGGAPDEAAVFQAARKLYADKTWQRLGLFTQAEGLDAARPLYYAGEQLPPLRDICEDCLQKTLNLPCAPGVLHGDLCLSNILIDLRAGKIKVIDPRGLDNDGTQTIYGDQKYDLAKLAHSCIGLYDFIISGYYQLGADEPYHYDLRFVLDERLAAVQAGFWEKRFIPQCSVAEIMPLTVLLFLSMLPLHNEDRRKQRAFFANALRLYRAHVLA